MFFWLPRNSRNSQTAHAIYYEQQGSCLGVVDVRHVNYYKMQLLGGTAPSPYQQAGNGKVVGAVSSLHPKSLRAEDTNSPTELTDYTEGFYVNAIWRKPFCEISGFCGRKYKN